MDAKPNNQPELKEEKKEKKSGMIFIVLAGLFLLIAGVCVYFLWDANNQIGTLTEQNVELEEAKSKVESELDAKIEELKKMDIENEEFRVKLEESIAELLEMKERLAKAENKAAEVDRVKGLLWANKKKYTMLSVERDSLVAANTKLTEENIIAVEGMKKAETRANTLSGEKERLAKTVSQGKLLHAYDMYASGVAVKSSGKEKSTDKAKKANRIRACFTLGQNGIADVGTKEIYMTVSNPTGVVFSKGEATSFRSADGEIRLYSTMEEIDYTGDAQQMCMYWALKKEAFPAGEYSIKIYADGESIGQAKVSLR